MTKVLVTESYLDNIADAIRAKLGTPAEFKPSQMATAIGQIQVANLETKSITANGTYTPSTGKDGFSQVTVNVPNSYAAGDEGKVVSSGALVAQTAHEEITENGTYDTTTNNSVTVNVSGGGGGGATILSGADEPAAAQGNNGDVYLKYTDYSDAPTGYAYLDYLATGATAGAYIGLTSSPDIAAEMVIQFTAAPTNNRWFYGAFRNYGAPILGYQNGRVEGYIVSGGAIQSFDSEKHIYRVDANGISVDGTVKQAGNWSSAPQGVALYLFARGGDGSPINNTRIYSCKMWNSGTLVRNFVPMKRLSDDAVGLYDLVNDVFYTNAGSQSFASGTVLSGKVIGAAHLKVSSAWQDLIGSDIDDVNTGGTPADDPFALKTYIESSGTQYIDTGYYVTDTSRFEVIAEVPQTNGRWPSPFGTRNADNVAEIMWWYKWDNGNAIGFNWIGGRTTLYSGTVYYGCKSKVVLSKTKAFIESENGNVDAKTISGGTVTSSYPLYLFSVDQGGSDGGSNVHCTMKLYRFRIYEGDTLVHEYVPWVDGSDVVCLKDTVSGNLFYNSGSGTFTYGTDGVTA